MEIKLTSYGASEEVTGSCHLLNIDGYRILIDCGMWQGDWDNYVRNWDKFLFDPQNIDAVILTHAHLDHCGRLPKLYAGGYNGPIYATDATIDLAKIVLEDSYFIMDEKAFRKKMPKIYSQADMNKTMKSFVPIKYYEKQNLNPNISFTLHNAGHILGSAIVEIKIAGKTIVFSGDIGGAEMPLVKNIDLLKNADYVICEGTYGDRLHHDRATRDQELIKAVQRATLNHATLLITIFAIERTQDILRVLNNYYEKHLDFSAPVFLDSPMAAKATLIYKKYLSYLNQAAQDDIQQDKDIFSFPHLKITNQIRKSKEINTVPPPKIIMAGSGMMEGGRMIHHLSQYIGDKNNNILFMGFQVPGTLGHTILNGAFDFDYYGRKIEIKAVADQIDGFSAHGDQAALLTWLKSFKHPKQILLVHGNKRVLEKFAIIIKEGLNLDAQVMKFNQPITLN
ncbi:MAG: MBL fold metallo-hydrolase [Patescibacteria group bacterium]|jgi:metallo-beta-lactamase family protein